MSPRRLRAYVLIFTRDILPPVTAAIWMWRFEIEPWMAPLIAALFGVPLVAPRGGHDE